MGCPTLSPCLSWPRKRSQKVKQTTPSPYDSQDSITITEIPVLIKDKSKEAEMEQRAESIRNKIQETHCQLLKLENYEPGEKINKLLGDLVPLCSQTLDHNIVQKIVDNDNLQDILPALRDICARAESCFESYSARNIIGNGKDEPEQGLNRLKDFRYYSNYLELAWLEFCAIKAVRRLSPKKVAFIGSGPLPLTSLCLLQELKKDMPEAQDIEILNIDCDQSAIDTSKRMCESLGDWSRGMTFLCAMAGSPEVDLREYDVVYLAALVGMSQEQKEDITLKVAETMRPGSLLVVRSAQGIRTCLYLEFDIATERLLEKLEPCLTMHPHGEVVNSVIVAKVKETTEKGSCCLL